MKTFTMKTLLVTAALVTAAPALADDTNMQVYRYVYSPERAIGSWDHAVDIARNDIRNETASDIKSDSLLSLKNSGSELKAQFGYAIYIPKRKERISWKALAP
ncbi:hypothetical protein EGC76_02195 [Pseudidiomarina gelatinasegens]|uniref:Uncharacterized protein n=1 Tax=Pseudidiomarina gelatinasegens TaxID=2487740 RepID=A0A443Z826_9GAMM|nr:hypothetical protein [Pseudidiomarina gelatinasegens]RWU13050.1 hypothetical protein EGC76_02195 [Pseudidiomarina gelatinasegens]